MSQVSFLQHYRRTSRISQEKLAEKLGGQISRTVISNWETGLSIPPKKYSKLISKILGVSESKLFLNREAHSNG